MFQNSFVHISDVQIHCDIILLRDGVAVSIADMQRIYLGNTYFKALIVIKCCRINIYMLPVLKYEQHLGSDKKR